MTVFILAQGAVFAVWAYWVFRALFRLLAVLRNQSGQMIPGLRATLSAPRVFLTDARFARDRRWIGLLTLCLLGMSSVFAAIR